MKRSVFLFFLIFLNLFSFKSTNTINHKLVNSGLIFYLIPKREKRIEFLRRENLKLYNQIQPGIYETPQIEVNSCEIHNLTNVNYEKKIYIFGIILSLIGFSEIFLEKFRNN